RRSWIVTGLLLLGCVAAVSGLRTDGLTITDSFTSKPDAITGQQAFDRSFGQGEGAPVIITAAAAKQDDVIAAVSRVRGVDTAPGSVCVAIDYVKVAAILKGTTPPPVPAGCAPPLVQVQPVDGRIL